MKKRRTSFKNLPCEAENTTEIFLLAAGLPLSTGLQFFLAMQVLENCRENDNRVA